MSGNRHQWMKFWPADWQNDAALATCSIAARGLWIGMICVMHNAEPYGHLTVNGKPATTRHIAAIARVPEKEAARLIAELEDAGVFSRSEDGTVYSRRMVRDAEQSEAGREAISKRWGKSKAAKVTAETPPEANSPPNRVPDREATSPPNTLEAEAEADTEAEKKEPPKPPANGGLACEAEFELFWQRYPRRDSKGHARKAWAAAVRKAPPDDILVGLDRYQFSETPRFQPLPATWLNGERWLSDSGDDGFDPVLRAVGLKPEDFDQPQFPPGVLIQ